MKETVITARLDPFGAAPAFMQGWLEFGKNVLKDGLEENLIELVKIRASQINGCALTLLIVAINGRNRVNVGFRAGNVIDRSKAA